MQKRSETEKIIIHCSATKPSQDIGSNDIDRWHRERGWLKIGYHLVIPRDGTLELGRDLDEVGAHAYGHNAKSVGVCMVGGIDEDGQPDDNFTIEQWNTLDIVIDYLELLYPDAEVIGHNDVSDKACPSFDVGEWNEARG